MFEGFGNGFAAPSFMHDGAAFAVAPSSYTTAAARGKARAAVCAWIYGVALRTMFFKL